MTGLDSAKEMNRSMGPNDIRTNASNLQNNQVNNNGQSEVIN